MWNKITFTDIHLMLDLNQGLESKKGTTKITQDNDAIAT